MSEFSRVWLVSQTNKTDLFNRVALNQGWLFSWGTFGNVRTSFVVTVGWRGAPLASSVQKAQRLLHSLCYTTYNKNQAKVSIKLENIEIRTFYMVNGSLVRNMPYRLFICMETYSLGVILQMNIDILTFTIKINYTYITLDSFKVGIIHSTQ